MKFVFLILLFFALNVWWGFSWWSCAGIALWVYYLIDLFEKSNDQIAFREYLMAIYGLNYLFSPALSYLLNQSGAYRMKLSETDYFTIAIPSVFLLQVGLNAVKTNIFHFQYKTVRLQSILNQKMLIQWFYAGLFFRFINPILPSDLAFMFYLLSGIRFVAAYGLFLVDKRRYKWHLFAILFLELLMALQQGMFHDFMMWLLFFGMFWVYITKPGRNLKLVIAAALFIFVYIIQITKAEYREQISSNGGEAGLSAFQDAVSKNLNEEEGGLFDESKTDGSLSRANQAWIFASTANRMNQVQDYQGMDLIGIYAEAAFLPRYFAPNKLKAGDKGIFNRFSGHRVASGTSMGLGFFADGYIAYGRLGTYAFALALGLIFSLVFKIVEKWSRISPFFILLIFPILTYAVRPDCETQTLMGHLVKGIFVFGCLAWYYSVYFSKKINDVEKEERLTAFWRSKTRNKLANGINR